MAQTSFPSLYVHFPFCEAKCHYCDFYSMGRDRTGAGDPDHFARALEAEARLVAPLLGAGRFETVFFGGGTPSLTPAATMERALRPLRIQERLEPGAEWTLEANPSSVTRAGIPEYRQLGVNRVSLGVQSLRDDHLRELGRVHSRDAAFRAIDAVLSGGITNLSVDLLCGVPGQSLEDLDAAITELARLPITHLSCYLLTLTRGNRLYRSLPDEDEQLSHLLFIDHRLKALGFEHYEISNFARPGFRARHNLACWQGRGYLALGPSAHGFDAAAGRRWKNVSSLETYAARLDRGESPVEWEETLTEDQRGLERWMLALRLSDGFPADWLDSSSRRARASRYLEDGILEAHPSNTTRLRLTPRGFALSDQVIGAMA